MSRYVLDANVLAKWFVPEEPSPQAVRLLEEDHLFLAPDLVYPETGNATEVSSEGPLQNSRWLASSCTCARPALGAGRRPFS
jgi:hypothetical protein